MVRINPSILAADFVNMERDLHRIATADLVHVDVMDNHFVPNLTFGPQMVSRIQAVSAIPLDVHLMISDVDRWAPEYAKIGAASVTFHVEASESPVELARTLRALGSRAGIALKPGTDVAPYLDDLAEFDQVLVMTVEPGFGGQSFMGDMMSKVQQVRDAADAAGSSVWLQVDGGIDLTTIATARSAGADTFVAGSAVYGAGDPNLNIAQLRAAASGHVHE